jgi:SAM-dependent methyltransferase
MRGLGMVKHRVGAMDPDREQWGNLEASLTFLTRAGLLDRPMRVLEIGCHRGDLLRHLVGCGHEAFGCDLEAAHLAAGPHTLRVCVADGQRLPFRDASFDLVLSFDVFEHMPRSDAHLAEVRRVLRPGGRYAMQTPNKWTNMVFHALIWARKYGLRRAFGFLEPPGHCALHSFWQLRRRLGRHGFAARFHAVPVVNEHFRAKIRHYAGPLGLAALRLYNPDRLPLWLRTNFYVLAECEAG